MGTTPNNRTDTDKWLAKIYKRLGTLISVVASSTSGNDKADITVGSGGYTMSNAGASLTGPFFNNSISIIITNGQAYILNTDFTQSGDTITWINSATFTNSQTLIAIR